MNSNKTKVISPNMRFGASFLDYTKHNVLAGVNDEVMMDKQTGQLVYKRKTDGKLIYFAQENFHLNTYIRQIKALMTDHRKVYVRPNSSNCESYKDVYFLSYNINMVDFEFADNAPASFIEGGVWKNSSPVQHSFVQETNGFFFQLNGRPRDRAILSYLTALYDRTYKNYNGLDEDILAKKSMYELIGYDNSNAVVNYTVSYYDSDDNVVSEDTSDGYIRVNEVSFVPFIYPGIYPRDRVAYAKIKINSVSTPKLADACDLLQTDAEKLLLESIKDSEDVGFVSCNVGIYICTSDKNFSTPTPDNTVPMLVMGWEEFEEELSRTKANGGATGIYVDVFEPDPTEWDDIGMWAEVVRHVYPDGTEEETEHETDLESIEVSFTATEISDLVLTTDPTDTSNYWVELFSVYNPENP